MNRKGLQDPPRAYAVKPVSADQEAARSRFAPADNLFDAIRADVERLGGIDFQSLHRLRDKEPPFSDLDEDWFNDETYKPE